MRSLGAIVERLVSSSTVAEVPMLRITVVEDHTAPTFSTPVVFTTHPTQHVLTATDPELPFLQRIDFPVETMSHIPAVTGGAVSSLSRQIRFTLANVEYEGTTLLEFLTANGRLDRARLLLQTLVVPPKEMGTQDQHRSFINGNLTEGDVVEWFDGLIDRVTAVGDQIECIGITDLPQVDWKLVPDDGSDPRDRGSRLPIPLGESAVVKCSNLIVGASASTDSLTAIQDDTVLIGLENIGVMPDLGSGMLGAEAISWTGRTGNTLTGVTRGEQGTSVANHVVGTGLIEISTVVLGVADRQILAVRDVFVQSFTTGSTIHIPDLLYSVDYNDETNLPGTSGDGITTVTFNGTQVAAVVNQIVADAAVTTQAEYASTTVPNVSIDIDDTITSDNSLVLSTSGATGNWTTIGTAPTWTRDGGGTQQNLRTIFSNNLAGTGSAAIRFARFGFDIDCTTLNQTAISVGLIITGAQAALVGVPDGTVVASVELTETGTITDIFGPTFQGSDDGLVGMLYDVTLDVANGEVSGGNPSVVFEIQDTRIEVSYYSDSVTAGVFIRSPMNVFLDGNTVSASSPYINSEWTGPGEIQVQRLAVEPRTTWEFTQTIDPIEANNPELEFASMDDTLTNTLELSWDGIGGNSSTSTTVEFEATGDWSALADKPVGVTSITANGNTSGNIVTLTLTNLVRNARAADFIGTGWTLKVQGAAEGDRFGLNVILDTKYIVEDPGFELSTRVEDAEIQSAAGGIGIEFYALCDGPEAPDGNYIANSGDLLEAPADLIQYWLREVGGYSASEIDHAGTFASSVTPLADYKWGFDARNLGPDFASVLARMGHEARSNLVRPSGGTWKMLYADTSFEFPTPTLTVDALADLTIIGKDDSELRTRQTINYAFDPRRETFSDEAFRQVQTTVPADAAVVVREAEYGRKDDLPRSLLCHTEASAAGVTDWRLWMELELGREGRLFSARVDTWQGMALEIGDAILLSHPKIGPAPVKTRVLEVQRSQTRGLLLRFVEVL